MMAFLVLYYRLMKYKVSSSFYYHNFSISETCLKLLKIAKRLKKKPSYKYVVIIVLKIHRYVQNCKLNLQEVKFISELFRIL